MRKFLWVVLLLPFSLSAQINLQKGLQAYYTLDGSKPTDQSGQGHTGVISGTVSSVTGIKDKAYFFDGSSYVGISNATGLNIGKKGSVSISIWFKIDPNDKDRTKPRVLIGKRIDASTNTDYILFTSGGKVCWGTGSSADTAAWMTFKEPSLNVWHHIVATMQYNGSTGNYYKEAYLDGKLVKKGTTPTKADSVTSSLRIGEADIGTGTAYFDGSIDEVRLYNRVLDSSEINALYTLAPLNDAGIDKNSIPASFCEGNMPVKLSIHNFGLDSLYNCNVHCTVNGLALSAYAWSGHLADNTSSGYFTIDSFQFKTGKSYLIKAWTTLPNGVTDENHADDTVTATVTVNSLPKINAGTDQAICFGQAITLGSKPVTGNIYQWASIPSGFTSTSSQPLVLPSSTIIYILKQTDTATGCSATDSSIILVNPLPVAKWTYTSVGNDYSFTPLDTTLNSYLWTFGDNTSSTQSKPKHNYAGSNSYKVSLFVENKFHCKAEYDSTLSIITTIYGVERDREEFKIFPIPARDHLSIKLPPEGNKEIRSLKVINLSGLPLRMIPLAHGQNEVSIDINGFEPGLYIVLYYDGPLIAGRRLISIK